MPMFEYWLDIGRHEDLKKFKNSALEYINFEVSLKKNW